MSKQLLLDTCAIIWLTNLDGELSQEARSVISEADCIFISSISGWELGNFIQKKKLALPLPVHEWLDKVLRDKNISVLNVDLDIACSANNLPLIHRDPADRLIIATALKHNLSIITKDRKFLDYGVNVIGV